MTCSCYLPFTSFQCLIGIPQVINASIKVLLWLKVLSIKREKWCSKHRRALKFFWIWGILKCPSLSLSSKQVLSLWSRWREFYRAFCKKFSCCLALSDQAFWQQHRLWLNYKIVDFICPWTHCFTEGKPSSKASWFALDPKITTESFTQFKSKASKSKGRLSQRSYSYPCPVLRQVIIKYVTSPLVNWCQFEVKYFSMAPALYFSLVLH